MYFFIFLVTIIILVVFRFIWLKPKDHWKTCEQNSQCIIVYSSCSFESVNKSYEKEMETFYERFFNADRVMSCSDRMTGEKPVCNNKKCDVETIY